LSPEKHTRSAPAARLARAVTDVDERARPEVVDEHELVPPRHLRQVFEAGLLREADDAEVRLVHTQEHGCLGTDRRLVVGRARAVGRADLSEPGTGPLEHVGDAKTVTDLDQLAARDEHVTSFAERGEGEHHRGRVVVDDEPRLATG